MYLSYRFLFKRNKIFLNKVLSGFLGVGSKLPRPRYLTPRLTSSHRKIVDGQYYEYSNDCLIGKSIK